MKIRTSLLLLVIIALMLFNLPAGAQVQINAGGPAVAPFVADQDFSGGTTINHANTIDLSGATNPAPMAVYQTARIGSFSYTIAGFTAGSSNTVRLHFAETYWGTAGSRIFNVTINNTAVLTNFDIFAAAGAKNKAVIEQFTVNANSSGQYVLQFTAVKDNSLVSGIEVLGQGTPSPDFSLAASPTSVTVNAGASATVSITSTPSGNFSGAISLSASGLPAGATASFNPASIGAPGTSTLTISTSSSTPDGSSVVTITGKSGSLTHTDSVTLNVNGGTGNVARAQGIVSKMSLTDKVSQLHGTFDSTHYRVVVGIPSEGIPDLNVTNGPAGAAGAGPGHGGRAVAFSAPISLAATFDPAAAHTYGTLVGKECKFFGNGLVEGPDINMARVPFNGRTFEAYGEDPYLASQIVVNDIQGIQSNGIIAESKHYAANNQETNRGSINAVIDERTLREIYLPHFEASVKQGHVGAFMCAYNKVNGTFNCENDVLLHQILRGNWGFTGFVTTDFGAQHSTVASANAGTDLEMPQPVFYGSAMLTDLQNGTVAVSTVDNILVRRFATMMDFGIWDTPPVNQCPDPTNCFIPSPMAQQDGAAERPISEEGMVLLKNTGGILPLKATQLHSIALIGPFATHPKTGGGGSATVNPIYSIYPQAGLQSRVGSGVTVTLNDGSNISSAVSLAASSNVAIVMVGVDESEGTDLTTLALPGTDDSLIEQVVAAQPKTIVVIKSGSPVLMPWVNSVPAILEAWYPGSEDGNAVAAVLFGDFNPSGKLPITFPVSNTQIAANTPSQYPGVNGVETYSEGVKMGYRYYDANNLQPLFPFGFGLSYTTFSFQNLAITPASTSFSSNPNQTVAVDFDITNTGPVAGAEVGQVYVGIPSVAVSEPPKWLKGFQRISLTPGQTGHAHLLLDMRSFAYWDVNSHSWKVAPGTYQIVVGASSRDIRLQGQISIN
ncbi:MAG TPA: glycoside hydrolase family 3 C-terminal domain-containing protein [Terriglobales bacterium]|nr:glycoside hydrolase family 3 C-terminal domain-containing protein [Terriglobales bacterium]